MEEIVKNFDEVKRKEEPIKKMANVKVKQPILPKIFSIYLLLVGIAALVIAYFAAISDSASTDSEIVEGIIFIVFTAFALFASSILIFMRQYLPAGMLTLTSGILISFGFWYVGIPTGIVGILILRSREKLEDAIFNLISESTSMHIKEMAEKLKRTEADIEIAINTLNDSGKSVNFNLETRVISV